MTHNVILSFKQGYLAQLRLKRYLHFSSSVLTAKREKSDNQPKNKLLFWDWLYFYNQTEKIIAADN